MLIKNTNRNLNRVLVLALDGVPYSLVQERLKIRPASIWHKLLKEGNLYRINSSRPEVSSVAWASYLTGSDPGEHGLFGFVDRRFNPFELYFPNGASLKMPTTPELVSEAGGTVVSINFPATFPPKSLNGLVIGGFLGVRLENNVKPISWLDKLRNFGYVIDADTSEAYRDKDKFYEQLCRILESRYNAALTACREFNWTLFQFHIMETDRLFHFYWDDEIYRERFHSLLDRIEEMVASFSDIAKKENVPLVILSDHGFTRAKRIFFINAWLKENGFLQFDNPSAASLQTISQSSSAYALPPARIFINLAGREPMGRIRQGSEYELLCNRLTGMLLNVRDPLNNEPIFDSVQKGRDLYSGSYVHEAPDLIALPKTGIDLKADFSAVSLFETPSTLIGTHTFENAIFYIRGEKPDWVDGRENIASAGRYVQKLIGV